MPDGIGEDLVEGYQELSEGVQVCFDILLLTDPLLAGSHRNPVYLHFVQAFEVELRVSLADLPCRNAKEGLLVFDPILGDLGEKGNLLRGKVGPVCNQLLGVPKLVLGLFLGYPFRQGLPPPRAGLVIEIYDPSASPLYQTSHKAPHFPPEDEPTGRGQGLSPSAPVA